MNKPKMTICKTKDDARQKAIDWQYWQGEQSLSCGEMAEWSNYFDKIGWKFGLTQEFKENGII